MTNKQANTKFVVMDEFANPIGICSYYEDASELIEKHEKIDTSQTSFVFTPSADRNYYLIEFYDSNKQKYREFEAIKVKEF